MAEVIQHVELPHHLTHHSLTSTDPRRTSVAAGERIGLAPTLGMVLPLRVFLAAGWLRAGAEKVRDHSWESGGTLRVFLEKQHRAALPFFRPVMDHAIAPGARLVALTVMVTQLLCGIALASGRFMKPAVRWACLMNITFILAGRVNPSAFYLVIQIVVLFALADGALGVRGTAPCRRTIVASVTFAAAGLAMVPFVRTIEPATVIDDPAMMLVFLGLVTAATLLVRFGSCPNRGDTLLGRLWHLRLGVWSHAIR